MSTGVLAAVLAAVATRCLVTAVTASGAARARARFETGGRAPGPLRALEHEAPARLLPLLRDAALPIPPGRAWLLWVLGGPVLVLGAALAGGAGAALVLAATWVVLPAAVLACRRGAAGRAVDAALPEALEAIAASLRGGASTQLALRDVAGRTGGLLGDELATVCGDLDVGVGLAPALEALERRRPEPGVRLAVAALLLGAEAGGAHARALDGVADGVRARHAVGAEVRALASQARLSAVVIALAPLAFGVLAAGADGATASFLLRTPLGLACLVVGLVLDGAGALWMHRIAQVEP